MKIRKSILIAAIVTLSALAGLPAVAQWSDQQRDNFTKVCLEACRKNPKVPEAQRPQCDDYCLCIVSEGQKLFNEIQFRELAQDFDAGKQTPAVKQFQGITPVCNRKAFAPR